MRRPLRALSLLAVGGLLLASCKEESKTPTGPLTPSDLRSGFQVIAVTPPSDNPNMASSTLITDAAVEGDTIAVVGTTNTSWDLTNGVPPLDGPEAPDHYVTTSTSSTLVLLLSRDAGKTWTRRGISVGNVNLYQTGTPGIALYQGNAYLMVNSFHTVPNTLGGERVYPSYVPLSLDLETGKAQLLRENMEMTALPQEERGKLYVAWSEQEIRPGTPDGYGNYFWGVFDLPTRASLTSGQKPFTPADGCRTAFFPASPSVWSGLCFEGGKGCWVALDPSSQTGPVKGACAALSTAQGWQLGSEGGGLFLYTEDDHAKARVFGAGEVLDLGPGRMSDRDTFGLHERYGGFVPVIRKNGPGGMELVRVTRKKNLVRMTLASPCLDDARCPHVQVMAFRNVARHKQLVVSEVWANSGQQSVVVGWEDFDIDPLLDKFSDDVSSTRLEQLCIAEALCFPLSSSASNCRDRWTRRLVAPGATDAAYERFLQANPSDCASIGQSDPVVVNEDYNQASTERCVGDVSYSVLMPLGIGVSRDCRDLNGGTCTMVDGRSVCMADAPACADKQSFTCDSRGRAVDCARGVVEDCPARGTVCRDGACTLESWPCPGEGSSPPVCQDGVAYGCNTSPRDVTHCARLGLGCLEGRCGAGSVDDVQCGQLDGDQRCEGSVLHYCNVTRRTVDCAALGAICEDLGDGSAPRCAKPKEVVEPCDLWADQRCEGTLRYYCDIDMVLQTQDCAAQGKVCVNPGGNNSPQCQDP